MRTLSAHLKREHPQRCGSYHATPQLAWQAASNPRLLPRAVKASACTLGRVAGVLLRDPDLRAAIDDALQEKDRSFGWYSLPFVRQLPRVENQAQRDAELAAARVQKQVEDVYQIFEAKLMHDESSFRLYLARLSDEDERARGALRTKKLRMRHMGEQAARAFMAKNCHFRTQPAGDTPELQRNHTDALNDFLEMGDASKPITTLIVLDASCVEGSQIAEKVSQAMILLNRDPVRNVLCVLCPWSRDKNSGHEIRPGPAVFDSERAFSLSLLCFLSLN